MHQLYMTRRKMLTAIAGAATAGVAGGVGIRTGRAADNPFKIAMFTPLSGPAALFAPTSRASAELAVDEVNSNGGILGRPVKLLVGDAGGPAGETARSAVKMILDERVDAITGSCDSSSREALIGAIKGKVPFVFTPVFEGGVCAPNTFVLGDTPAEQINPSLSYLMSEQGVKRVFLIGNDYVWPKTLNNFATSLIKRAGGEVVGDEYVPLGAANRFEEAVNRIKSAKPDLLISTLVGIDNINFNRTFAGFGLDRDIKRIGYLLEENTLNGIGVESSHNMFSCMSFFANVETPKSKPFIASFQKKFGAKAPPLSNIGVDTYSGVTFLAALTKKAGSMNAPALLAASEELSFESAAGVQTMRKRRVDKTMYLAACNDGKFNLVKAFENVPAADVCST